jgi:F-type H+-transporting ATPase subunit b
MQTLAMQTLLALEEGAEEGIELFPEPAELIWGAVAFLLLLAIMTKFVFPRVNEMLDARTAAIQGKMEEADAKLQEAEASKARFEESIGDARGEANRIIEEAKSTAESLRADIVAKAEEEARGIVERAQGEVAAERDRALQELRTEVGALSVELASRIVERELDASTHQGLVDEYIQQLSRNN